eukprot:4246382-Alexandrium_andersonii.AAC.1
MAACAARAGVASGARNRPVRLMSALSGEPLMLPGVGRAPEYTVPRDWSGGDLVERGDWLIKLEDVDG